jgi:prepilin-type N-terminal cleavage/methylation domain-containing protein
MRTRIHTRTTIQGAESIAGGITAGQPRAGFSLIELLFVMMIMGILMSIALPSIDLGRSAVASGIMEIQMAVAVSRGKAIVNQHDVAISFDESALRLYVLHDANNNGTMDTEEQQYTVQFAEGATFGRGSAAALDSVTEAISFAKNHDGLPTLKFHRNGAASEEGTLYLTSLRGAGGGYPQDSRALVIDRSTGRVHCYSYRTLAWSEGC